MQGSTVRLHLHGQENPHVWENVFDFFFREGNYVVTLRSKSKFMYPTTSVLFVEIMEKN